MEIRREDAQNEPALYWHAAAYADIQIEFEEESDHLIFENEHQLGTKPMAIDILIIKKKNDFPVQKNIGRIFRKHNIIEYKSPSDYLSIDDFYKVYGYTCFYKADTPSVDSIGINELTISFICTGYPGKLIRHLREQRGYTVEETEPGIYYITGDVLPIQIIVTGRLSEEKNLWLKSLTDQLTDEAQTEKLVEEYQKHKENTLYHSVMNMIMLANKERFQEVYRMLEALQEIMGDELEEKKREGEKIGENRINNLNVKLSRLGRTEDIVKAAQDPEYQRQLFEEFGL